MEGIRMKNRKNKCRMKIVYPDCRYKYIGKLKWKCKDCGRIVIST